MHISIFAWILLSTASALSVPFDPALINLTHEVRKSPCGYPRVSSSSLTLNAKSLTLLPTINNENRGPAYTGTTVCEGRIDLYYRHRPKHMWIEVIPDASKPFLLDANGQPATDQGPACSELQKKIEYWPWGPSRTGFVAVFKKVYRAAVWMKGSSPNCVTKTGNLDAILSYLYTVAFDYFISLDEGHNETI